MSGATHHLPIVDMAALGTDQQEIEQLDRACREIGFFGLAGHGVDRLLDELDASARAFFALPTTEKQQIAMSRAGRAWRGWFPLYGEVTSGTPDGKEGLYFGIDHPPDHPRVLDGSLLHGQNLFPDRPAELAPAVDAWLDAMRPIADTVMAALGAALGVGRGWFAEHLTGDPTILFRIFRYPPTGTASAEWGVGEHTDYGLLTLLAQDGRPGLEVRRRDGTWMPVTPDRDVLVCNLGDMLERLTRGRYRSTPHRVRNTGTDDRLSFPYFFDPSWDATVPTLALPDDGAPALQRWDGADPIAWEGTYGDYLSAKVAKVFADLA